MSKKLNASSENGSMDRETADKLPPWVLIVSVASGLIFLVIILIIALFVPKPTDFQFFVFRVILALAAAAFGATISGFLKVDLPLWGKGLISAGGALALFVLVYYVDPPKRIVSPDVPKIKSAPGKEIPENAGTKNGKSTDSPEREDIKVFSDRAEAIVWKLSPYIDHPEVKSVLDRFKKLHEDHIDACIKYETIRAHDLSKEIYDLLSDLEEEKFWHSYSKERIVLARLYCSKPVSDPPQSSASSSGAVRKKRTENLPKPQTKTEKTEQIDTNKLGMTFVYIPPGNFMMGSPVDEFGRYTREVMHQVTISEGFYIQTTEVTQKQWVSIMGENPSRFKDCGDNCPVESVSWNDVQVFIKELNWREGKNYRLPTEAEWEYVCRAGTQTRYYTGGMDAGLDRAGWYDENSGRKTHPVGAKEPNAFGLYDMHGNVWEWCWDWYGDYPTGAVTDPIGSESGSARVIRGGSWSCSSRDCRAACRTGLHPVYRSFDGLGFRLVLPSQQTESGRPDKPAGK